MRIFVRATDQELIEKSDLLLAHVEDLRDAACARAGADELTKAAQLSIKEHPKVAMTQLRRQWVTGYKDQMQAMVAEIQQFLEANLDAVGSV